MKKPDFTTTILVDASPETAFNAITNLRGWWSEEIEGDTTTLNEEFTYDYEDMHFCRLQLVELVPNQKVVWLVKENYFKFTKDKTEWTGTKLCFEISEKNNKTQVRFTHEGLVPAYECFEVCSSAWTHYIGESLFNLVTTGKGDQNSDGNPKTADEERLRSAHN